MSVSAQNASQRQSTTLILCGLAALLEGFDNQSLGVAGPRIIAEFHLSSSQAAYSAVV